MRSRVFCAVLITMGAIFSAGCTQHEEQASSKAVEPAEGGPEGIAAQIGRNLNIGGLKPTADDTAYVVVAHVTLQPDGTITGIMIDNDHPDDRVFEDMADRVKRALLITHRLVLPPGKTYEHMTFRFPLSALADAG